MLLREAERLGFKIRVKEVYRWPQMAEWNATHCATCSGDMVAHDDVQHAFKPIGIRNSLHCDGLAVDLVLFKGGQPCWDTEQYRELGEWWDNLDVLCSWGGRFGDGGHFSIRHDGKR